MHSKSWAPIKVFQKVPQVINIFVLNIYRKGQAFLFEPPQFKSVRFNNCVFSCFSDVGYSLKSAPGHVLAILNTYFHEYFPRAIKLASDLMVLGYRERFIYTTHPWLVSLYLDCPPNTVLSGIKLQVSIYDMLIIINFVLKMFIKLGHL